MDKKCRCGREYEVRQVGHKFMEGLCRECADRECRAYFDRYLPNLKIYGGQKEGDEA
jgi:hypothetical protein